MNGGDQTWSEIQLKLRRRDRALTHCYLLGLAVAGACLFLPYRLSQLGAGLMLVALTHMIARIYRAHRAQPAAEDYGMGTEPALHSRLVLVESVLFNVPLLVAVNLIFMGLPLSRDPLQEASLDCWFLASTVVLLTMSYCWNQRARRALEFCVGSRAVESSRSE